MTTKMINLQQLALDADLSQVNDGYSMYGLDALINKEMRLENVDYKSKTAAKRLSHVPVHLDGGADFPIRMSSNMPAGQFERKPFLASVPNGANVDMWDVSARLVETPAGLRHPS